MAKRNIHPRENAGVEVFALLFVFMSVGFLVWIAAM